MDAMHEAALAAVIEGNISHYTVALLQGVADSFEDMQDRFSKSAFDTADSDAQNRLVGAVAGVAACRLILQETVYRLTQLPEEKS